METESEPQFMSPKPISHPPESASEEEPLPFPVDGAFLKAAHKRAAEAVPELAAYTPEVRAMSPNVLLLYTVPTPLPGALTLTRITRVVVNAEGQIIKLSTSRGVGPLTRTSNLSAGNQGDLPLTPPHNTPGKTPRSFPTGC